MGRNMSAKPYKLGVKLQPRNDQCGRRTRSYEVKVKTEEEVTVRSGKSL